MSGGTANQSFYRTFDIDTQGNIVAGGRTLDNALFEGSLAPGTYPWLEYIDKTGVFKWTKTYADATGTYVYNNVMAVKFFPSGSKIAMTMDKPIAAVPTFIIIVDASQGTVQRAFFDTYSMTKSCQFRPGTLLLEENPDNLYYINDIGNRWIFLKLSLSASFPITPTFYWQSVNSANCGGSLVITRDLSTDGLLIGGLIRNSTTQCESGNVARYSTSGTLTWLFNHRRISTMSVYIQAISLIQDESDQAVWTCGYERNATNSSDLIDKGFFQTFLLSSGVTPDINSNMAAIGKDADYKCIQIKAYSRTLAYAVASTSSAASPNYIILKITKSATELIANPYFLQNKFTIDSNNQIYQALFPGNDYLIFATGGRSYYQNDGSKHSYAPRLMGMLFKTKITEQTGYGEQCLTLDIAYDTSINFVDPPLSDTYFLLTSTTLITAVTTGTSFTQATVNAYASVSSNVYRDQCNPDPQLVSPTLDDYSRDQRFASGPLSYNVPQFTISATTQCTSDISYDYAITPSVVGTSTSSFTFDTSTRDLAWTSSTPYSLFTLQIKASLPKSSSSITNSGFFTVNIYDACQSSTITPDPVTVTQLEYVITQSQVVYQVPQFTMSVSGCPIQYSAIGSFPVIITFDSTTREIKLGSTTDNSQRGVYTMEIYGIIQQTSPQISASTPSIQITIKHQCSIVTIDKATVIGPYNYDMSMNGSPSDSANVGWTRSDSSCEAIIYEIVDINTTPTTGLVSLQGSDVIRIQTTDMSYVGQTFDFKLIAYVKGESGTVIYAQAQQEFTVTVTNVCKDAVITTTSVSEQKYVIGSNQLDVSVASLWTVDLTQCGPIIYTAEQSTDSINFNALDSSLLSFTAGVFSVFSNDDNKENTYQIILSATLTQGGVSSSEQFTLHVYSCNKASINFQDPLYSLNNVEATLFGSEINVIIMPVMQSSLPAPLCGDWTYEIIIEDNQLTSYNDGNNNIQIPFYLNTPDTLSFQSNQLTDMNNQPYEISMNVYQSSYKSNMIFFSFQVLLKVDCTLEVISNTSPINDYLTYDIYAGAKIELAHLIWTQKIPGHCPDIIYSLIDTDTTIEADSTVFQISPVDSKIYLQTTDLTKARPYNLLLSGSIPATSIITSIPFKVDFLNICDPATISPTTIADLTFTIGDPPLIVSFHEWSESTGGLCSPISYTIKQSVYDINGMYSLLKESSIDTSFINYSDRTFTIQPTMSSQAGVHALKIIGTLSKTTVLNQQDTIFKLTVIDLVTTCIVTQLTVDPSDYVKQNSNTQYEREQSEYTIGVDGIMKIQVKEFIQVSDCKYSVSYTLSVQGLQTLPSFIKYVQPREIQIQSTQRTDALKPFNNIILTGTLTNPTGTVLTTELFLPLIIKSQNLGPPYFDPPLSDLELTLGQQLIFDYPKLLDPDKDDLPIVSSIDYSGAKDLISGKYPTIVINAGRADNYIVTVNAKDDNPVVLKMSYSFNLIIKSPLTQQDQQNSTESNNNNTSANNSTSNSSLNSNDTTNQTGGSSSAAGGGSFGNSNNQQNKKTTSYNPIELMAYIKKITNTGVVTIAFNKDVIVLNTQQFNTVHRYLNNSGRDLEITNQNNGSAYENLYSQLLNVNMIKYSSESGRGEREQIQKWNVTKMEKRSIEISIEFDNPLNISSGEVSQYLTMLLLLLIKLNIGKRRVRGHFQEGQFNYR